MRPTYFANFRSDLRGAGKPREVEGILDIYLIRPAGFLLVRVLKHTPITPNMVSAGALLAGCLSGYYYFKTVESGTNLSFPLVAAALLYLHSVLDSADGQLARTTQAASESGRIVDGICDYLAFAAIYVGILAGQHSHAAEGFSVVFAVAVLSGCSHAVQSALTEFHRTKYLDYVYGNGLVSSDAGDSAPRGERPEGTLHTLHTLYEGVQRSFTASSHRLDHFIRAWLRQYPDRRPAVSSIFADEQVPMLRAWTLLGPNSHKVGLVLASFAPAISGFPVLQFGTVLFFYYNLVVLNGVLLVVIRAQARTDRRIEAAIERLAPIHH